MLFAHNADANWKPRGDHAAVIAKGSMFVFGGRGGTLTEYYNNPMYNDVWEWDMGVDPDTPPSTHNTAVIEWINNTWAVKHTHAQWSPRAGISAVYSPEEDKIVLVGGEVFVPPTPTASPRAVADKVAYAAAEAPLGQDKVSPHRPTFV